LHRSSGGRVLQAAIRGFHKHVRRPEGGVVAVVVVRGDVCGFDLIERHAFPNQVCDAVANDGHHIPIFQYIGLVADAPVAGDDVGAPLLFIFGNERITSPTR